MVQKISLDFRFVWILKATFSTMHMVFNLTAFLATALVVIKANWFGIFVLIRTTLTGSTLSKIPIKDGTAKGHIDCKDHLPQASGLVFSRQTDDVLWIHNSVAVKDDRISAISEQGERALRMLHLRVLKTRTWRILLCEHCELHFYQIPWDGCFRGKLSNITRDKDDIRAI